MSKELNITLIQAPLIWEDISANLKFFGSLLRKIEHKTDLIILPEMFTTGFSMNTKDFSETIDGKAMQWLAEKAAVLQSVITTSLIIRENDKFYNRLIWMQADGKFQTYDKRHLFRMSDEHKYFTGGNKKLIVELKDWRICPLICYDLRFPVWSRNDNDYDFLLYVANWPKSRRHVWKNLLIARALENQVYVAGVNRIGTDGYGTDFSGDSVLISPKGIALASAKPNETEIISHTVSLAELNEFRKSFPVGLDADSFEIKD
ncbi:MAG: amidohydrolase [Bacteroidia bacterium]|nr:MAG: amidohydrolase [Bacteroidia bacterium]